MIGNHGSREEPSNLAGAVSHPEGNTVNVDDSLISATDALDKSVEKKIWSIGSPKTYVLILKLIYFDKNYP